MSFVTPFLSLRTGLLLLTAASLSFSTPRTMLSAPSFAVMGCSPVETALHRDLQEAQRRFAALRAKNFRLRQQLMVIEAQRAIAEAKLLLIREKAVKGDMEDLTRYEPLNSTIRELQEREWPDLPTRLPVQVPLRAVEPAG